MFKLTIAVLTFGIGVVIALTFITRRPMTVEHRVTVPPADERVDVQLSRDANPVAVTTVDPFEIKRQVDAHEIDVDELWKSLGISAELRTVYSRIGSEHGELGTDTFGSCGDCVAEISRAELDGRPGKELLLKLYQRWGNCRYLVFKDVGKDRSSAWKLLGHADHDFARYYMPEHRVEVLGGKSFLVLNVQGMSGTGVSLAYDRWYEVDDSDVREVLSLPATGHQCSDMKSLCRAFKSQVISRTDGSGGDSLQVAYSVDYSANYYLVNEKSDVDLQLFSKRQKAVYVRSSDSSEYLLDPQQSNVTEEEPRTVYNIDTLSAEDFLRFNFDELKRVAKSDRGKHKEWLLHYLDECDETNEKTKLLQVLNGSAK